ncbi:MAG: hypothetical protein H6707_08195 [Deltaproteobacteria bacterium]|nr:hypothetical protein [Deltaproteobacteria bacterium]
MAGHLSALLTCLVLVGCGVVAPSAGGFDPDSVGLDDPRMCYGDPDKQGLPCEIPGLLACEQLGDGNKCNVATSPDGQSGWTCNVRENSVLRCEKPGDVTGGGPSGDNGWLCVVYEGRTLCEAKPLNGGSLGAGDGQWVCSSSAEFGIACEQSPTTTGLPGAPGSTPVSDLPLGGGRTCFCPVSTGNPNYTLGSAPLATISTSEVTRDGKAALYAKLTFSTRFNDNTYGTQSSPCWRDTKKGDHKFKDLVGSDAAELKFTCDGKLVLGAVIDYISETSSTPSGYDSLCVSGGDGRLTAGRAQDVLGCTTSLAENFNSYGYVLTNDSPLFNDYQPPTAQPNWQFAVSYGIWVDKAALTGDCQVRVDYVHASPACGGSNSVDVEPCACP